MRLIHRERLLDFAERFKEAEAPLNTWAQAIVNGSFRHFVDLKGTFGCADYVKPYVVFNISGNRYRLIALVNYSLGLVSVEHVLTHAEYDEGGWKH